MFGVWKLVLFLESLGLIVGFTPTKNGFVEVDLPNLGKIQGKVEKSFFTGRPVYHFLGINYAKAPSKERRFKPPEKFGPWKGIYNATKMRQSCPQAKSSYYPPLDPDKLDVKEDTEDCLVVNVFAPQNDNKAKGLLPVLFYIHGGSFNAGSAYDFYPDFLLEEDIIMVVVQYRLGILGFLCLDTDEIPGNLGMLDILMGLEWVQDNIRAFGGNASDVTVVGQSAGAAAVSSLLISPLVREGLFHKIIIMSGSVLSSWAVDEDPVKSAMAMAKFLPSEPKTVEEAIECFKKAEVEDLIQAHSKFLGTIDIAKCGTSLVIQKAGTHKFLVEHPRKTYTRGEFKKVPVMGGTTREEGSSFVEGFYYGNGLHMILDGHYYERNVTRDAIKYSGFNDSVEIMADYLHNLYFNKKKIHPASFSDVVPGLVDICGVLLLKDSTYENLRLVSGQVPTFSYSFNFYGNISKLRGSKPSWNENEPLPPGVAHSDDLGYLFPSYRSNYTERELRMVKKMTSLWTNFVIRGAPTTPMKWPKMSTPFGPYLRLSDKDEIRQNVFDEFVVTSTEGFLKIPSAATTLSIPFVSMTLSLVYILSFIY